MITSFLPDLVTAISDIVQPVSDQCLAKGLIPESVYKRVLESGGTSEDKARTLILAIEKSTETDSGCLEILLSILEKELPFTIREKLTSEIRKEQVEKANTCRAVVPSSQAVQPLPSEELPREYTSLQSSLLGKLEDSIRQHERACAERGSLEEELKKKSREHEILKQEFEALKSQAREASSIQSSLHSKIADCEQEIETLKAKVKKLEHTIEEQGMKVKRGRNIVMLKTKKILAVVAQKSQAEAWEKAKEEMETKEREFTLTLQEMKLQIKELELNSMLYKKAKLTPSFDINPPDKLINSYTVAVEVRNSIIDYILENDQKFSKWRELGSRLGFSEENLDKIETSNKKKLILGTPDYNYHFLTNCILEMIEQWLKSYPGDSRGSNSYATYTWLKRALIEAELGACARDLPPYEKIIGN